MGDENYVDQTTEQLSLKLTERAIAMTGISLVRRLGIAAVGDGR
jgi:hypothetical protein